MKSNKGNGLPAYILTYCLAKRIRIWNAGSSNGPPTAQRESDCPWMIYRDGGVRLEPATLRDIRRGYAIIKTSGSITRSMQTWEKLSDCRDRREKTTRPKSMTERKQRVQRNFTTTRQQLDDIPSFANKTRARFSLRNRHSNVKPSVK